MSEIQEKLFIRDCNTIMTNHHSENIGEINGLVNNSTPIVDKIQRQEYDR